VESRYIGEKGEKEKTVVTDYNKTFIRDDQGGKNVENPLFPCSTHIHTHTELISEAGDEYSLSYQDQGQKRAKRQTSPVQVR
jgi:hypothetical protein